MSLIKCLDLNQIYLSLFIPMQPYEREREEIDLSDFNLYEICKCITERLWGNLSKPLNSNNEKWNNVWDAEFT